MKKIDINCDVGEGVNNEAKLLSYIQLCNIACGAHAGDEQLMREIVKLALTSKVKIGAHPSYPDKENFGRKSIKISSSDLKLSIQKQLNTLNTIIKDEGAILHHIKPHGALYNDIAKNEELSLTFLEAIFNYKKKSKLVIPFNSIIAKNALKQGFSIIYEGFADRNYNNDLSLVARNEKNAVLTDIIEIEKHVKGMLFNDEVTTISGKKITIKAATFCVHSDTENAIEIVKKLAKLF
jgi:UPF0271 protein